MTNVYPLTVTHYETNLIKISVTVGKQQAAGWETPESHFINEY